MHPREWVGAKEGWQCTALSHTDPFPSERSIMKLTRFVATAVAGAVLASGAALVTAPAASASTGTTPLAAVLTADGDQFDHDRHDYDIVTEAVLAVLAAKPDSAVGVLTQGDVALTAFLPTDQAFRRLVFDLTHEWVQDEADVFAAVAGLGIDTVETVLLYHVVPGATVTKKDAFNADGAALTTAQGGTVTVDVRGRNGFGVIRLVDNDPDDLNPRIVDFNINKGNVQIAHGINRVLRPLDL